MTRQRDKVARAELASVRWRCGYRWLHVVLKREGVPTRGSAAPFSECFASLLWIICFAPHAADQNAIRQATDWGRADQLEIRRNPVDIVKLKTG